MRSMEEDSRGEYSEDEHPSTDASEDSVEVHVNPISRPYPANLSRLPRKFRKAFERTSFYPGVKSPPNFKEEVSASPESPQGRLTPHSPVDFSVTSSVTTGRASLTCPPSPSTTARIRGSRRKLSEPRRVVDQECSKRPVEEEWHPRKTPKTETSVATPVQQSVPSVHPILTPNPFLGHFVPPQFLLPPAWAHVARHPYAHLVGLAPQLGLLPAAPYPLLPILPSRLSVSQQISPTHPPGDIHYRVDKSQKHDSYSKRLNGLSDKPLLISKTELSSSDGAIQPPVAFSDSVALTRTNLSSVSSMVRNMPSESSPKHVLSYEPISTRPPPKHVYITESVSSKPIPKHIHSVESLISTPKEEEIEIVDEEYDEAQDSRRGSPSHEDTIQCLLQTQSRQKQRNYKNMTRERRIEANARERTRVHTISAAFDALRQHVPSFSHNQKLSKLSVLRIASAYILSLSRLAGQDYSDGESNPTFEECVDLTTKTIQIEGKAKKKRDD